MIDKLDVDQIRVDVYASRQFGWCPKCNSSCFILGNRCRGCEAIAEPHRSPMPRLAEHCERLLELVALQEASIIRHVAKERELAEENEKLRRLVLQVTRENPMGEPANGQHKSII